MKVKDLIKALEKYDKEKDIIVRFAVSKEDELGYVLEVCGVYEYFDNIAILGNYAVTKEDCAMFGQVDLTELWEKEYKERYGSEKKMISKEKFVEIINRLKETQDTIDKINETIRGSKDVELTDFTSGAGIMICHDDIIVDLLGEIFNDKEDIEYFIYELDYGRKYKKGYVIDCDGNNIDMSTAEKLYEYLTKENRYEEESISN